LIYKADSDIKSDIMLISKIENYCARDIVMLISKNIFFLTLVFSLGFSAASAETLQEVVDYAVHNSPDVRATASDRRAVELQIGQARASYFPRLELDAGFGHEDRQSPNLRSGLGGWKSQSREELGLVLDQMIFDGFLTKNEIRRHTARANSKAHNVHAQAEIDSLSAIRAYIDLQRREELINLADENQKIHSRTNDQVTLRSTQGVGRKADSEQSAARLSRSETNLIAERGNFMDATANFVRVVGRPPSDLEVAFNPSETLPANPEDAVKLAVENHPVVKSAKADIESAYAQRESAKAANYPRLNFEISKRHDDDIGGFSGQSREFTAMVRLRYNLMTGGRDQLRLKETGHQIEQAKDIRDSAIRQVVQNTRLSWDAYDTATKQLYFFEKINDATIKTHSAYKKQFQLGQRTLLDLLDSANEMFVAKSDFANAKYDQLFAMYRIFASMGIAHSTLDVELPEGAELIPVN
jgi:adhesin transport system outer membrane protein